MTILFHFPVQRYEKKTVISTSNLTFSHARLSGAFIIERVSNSAGKDLFQSYAAGPPAGLRKSDLSVL